jgi:DNA polymerase III delta subunit
MVQRLQGHELYELNRALVQKDQVRSLTILDRMFRNLLTTRKKISRSGLPLIVLSTCIESEFRKLSLAKKFAPTNDLDGLASAIKVRNKHVAGIIFNNARRFSEEELENILIEIRHVDKRLKSTRLPAKLMLEELIMTICAPRAKVQKSQLQPL